MRLMRRILAALSLVAVAFPLFATQPNPSARQRELIEQLIEQTNAGNAAAAMMDAVFSQIEKQFLDNAAAKGNDPADIEEAKELFALFRERSSKIDFNGLMREGQIRIYAKHFTEQELADLVTFYGTSTGRKSIQVMPDLVREGAQIGAEVVGPKIDEVMKSVLADQEKKRPWRRTMTDLRTVASALESYAIDSDDESYPTGDYASLKETLEPYLSEFPEKDIWGHAYAYVVSPDRKHYRLVSAGADSNFEWDSRRIVAAKAGEETSVAYRERLEDDVIYADGEFLQLPVQAKPKE